MEKKVNHAGMWMQLCAHKRQKEGSTCWIFPWVIKIWKLSFTLDSSDTNQTSSVTRSESPNPIYALSKILFWLSYCWLHLLRLNIIGAHLKHQSMLWFNSDLTEKAVKHKMQYDKLDLLCFPAHFACLSQKSVCKLIWLEHRCIGVVLCSDPQQSSCSYFHPCVWPVAQTVSYSDVVNRSLHGPLIFAARLISCLTI